LAALPASAKRTWEGMRCRRDGAFRDPRLRLAAQPFEVGETSAMSFLRHGVARHAMSSILPSRSRPSVIAVHPARCREDAPPVRTSPVGLREARPR